MFFVSPQIITPQKTTPNPSQLTTKTLQPVLSKINTQPITQLIPIIASKALHLHTSNPSTDNQANPPTPLKDYTQNQSQDSLGQYLTTYTQSIHPTDRLTQVNWLIIQQKPNITDMPV